MSFCSKSSKLLYLLTCCSLMRGSCARGAISDGKAEASLAHRTGKVVRPFGDTFTNSRVEHTPLSVRILLSLTRRVHETLHNMLPVNVHLHPLQLITFHHIVGACLVRVVLEVLFLVSEHRCPEYRDVQPHLPSVIKSVMLHLL